jgi:hypothetical protein
VTAASDPASSIEALITELVQRAPDRPAATVDALLAALRSVAADRDVCALALSIARIVELVADDLVDPGIALPALAEACATLAAGVTCDADRVALEAARYRVETLQPMPDPPPKVGSPDVLTASLLRKR